MTNENESEKSPYQLFIESLDSIDELQPYFQVDSTNVDAANLLLMEYNLPKDDEAFATFVELLEQIRRVKKFELQPIFQSYLQALMWRLCLKRHEKPLDIAMTGFFWGVIFASMGQYDIEEE